MASTTTKTRVVVSSTAGRGPCQECGLIAELHLTEEFFAFAPDFRLVKALCLPHALGAETVSEIRGTFRKAA